MLAQSTTSSPSQAEIYEPPVRTSGPSLGLRSRAPVERWLAPVVVGLLALGLWQALTGVVSAFLLPSPVAVLQSFWQSITNGLLIDAAKATLTESLVGFGLGLVVAIPLGYGIAHSRLVASALEPYLAMSQALPAVAIAPLLVLWFGFGLFPIALLCALIVFFPIAIGTILGLRTLDREVLDAASVDGATRWTKFWYIERPLAMPSLMAGVRAGLTYSITGAVVGEFVVSVQGLGGLLLIARQGDLDSPLVFATLLALAILAALMYGAGQFIEHVFTYREVR